MLGGFSVCFYRIMSLNLGLVSRELPLSLSFVHRIIGWLSTPNWWLCLWTADDGKVD